MLSFCCCCCCCFVVVAVVAVGGALVVSVIAVVVAVDAALVTVVFCCCCFVFVLSLLVWQVTVRTTSNWQLTTNCPCFVAIAVAVANVVLPSLLLVVIIFKAGFF